MLTDAHATPYRLCQMSIKATPHCQYYPHEEGNTKHIIWECPRFAELRRSWSWPQDLIDRHGRPECSESALICSSLLPESTRSKWHQLQLLVAQLLYQWMEINRNPERYQQFVPEDVQQNRIERNVLPQQNSVCFTQALPLQWNPLAHGLSRSGQNGQTKVAMLQSEFALGPRRWLFSCSMVE